MGGLPLTMNLWKLKAFDEVKAKASNFFGDLKHRSSHSPHRSKF
jgi:hypothetical protein